ncbi:ATP-binding cassette domain-containing protein, partial [Mesorhizobium humile]|uniref:ATP-binding cassette domain-containing protein n=1 Tax=Mesorhizobium humile TaxID=3072313 RepID=UPI002A24665B
EEFALARSYTERLDLRASSLSQDVGTLSGGNQQKVVIAKWLATTPKVIILDEPTKGIDIGSKAAVHGFMAELVAQGLSVIMVSSELPEILGMSDRVVVMREGRIAATYDNKGSRRPSGLRKTNLECNSLAHRTTWLRSDFLSVIMVSPELPEILGMSDRVVVMREGRIAATYDNKG